MFLTLIFLILTILILTHSEISFLYALNGFALWYGKMIPSLLPFMIMSGILIRLNLSEKFASVLHPLLGKIYKCNNHITYAIIIGFLCGFPMGAKVTADLLKNKKINSKEAEFLLAFNNNIGPVYFCGFVIPLLHLQKVHICLFGMYGIPLIYAYFIRRTIFNNETNFTPSTKENDISMLNKTERISLFDGIDASIHNSIQSILMLCGYMILFNTLNILPHFIVPSFSKYISPILEITGGLSQISNTAPMYSLCLLQFGGLSCIAQTNCMIRNTNLSLKKYILHKVNISIITFMFYFAVIYLFKIKLF